MAPIRRIGLTSNPHKAASGPVARRVIERLLADGIEVRIGPDLSRLIGPIPGAAVTADLKALGDGELVIVLGGDGTLLHAVRALQPQRVPILGVNLGSLGFLTEVNAGELESALPRLAAGDFEIVERPLLEASIEEADGRVAQQLLAMNDVVVDEGSPTRRAVRLRLSLGAHLVGTFIGDGIVVATPAGSTAYSLSAGGPILNPELKALVATPICPHTMSIRPLVYPDDQVLTVEDLRQNLRVKVSADGQAWSTVPEKGRVRIARHRGSVARLVSLGHNSHFDVLRAKLRWGLGDRDH